VIGERKKLCSAKLKKKKKKQLGVSRESERVRLCSRVSIKSPFGVLQYRRQMSELCDCVIRETESQIGFQATKSKSLGLDLH